MDNIEQLKQELINQKQAIENKGGIVNVLNRNPSPSEITAGINSIKAFDQIDFSKTTATEADVLEGKQFYNSEANLVAGTYKDLTYELYLYEPQPKVDSGKVYDFVFPENFAVVKDYIFSGNPNQMRVWLSPNTTTINNYAFSNNGKITLMNFHEMTKLTTIDNGGLNAVRGIDLMDLPETLKLIGEQSFADSHYTSSGIKVPTSSLTILRTGAFMSNTRITLDSFILPAGKIDTLPESMLEGVAFNCDLVLPSTIKTIGNRFNFNGGFINATFPASIKTVGSYCFYINTTNTSNINSITFLGTTVPTIGSQFIRSSDRGQVKIYVPDSVVDEYKAELSVYTVVPLSEKP